MKRFIVLLCAFIVLAPSVSQAFLFRRCRRGCFTSHYVAPVVARAPVYYNVINNNPPPIAPQGDTFYGVSEITYSKPADVDALLNRMLGIVEQQGERFGAAQLGVAEVINLEAERQGEERRLQVTGQQIRAFAQELQAGSITQKYQGGQASEVRAPNGFNDLQRIVLDNCVKCHGSKAPKAGLSLVDLSAFTAEKWMKVVEAVDSGRMPKPAAAGKPTPLPFAARREFWRYLDYLETK